MNTPVLHEPNVTPLSSGPSLRETLEALTASAVAHVRRLGADAWDDEDPAPAIAVMWDVVTPAPDWESGTVTVSASPDQRMRAVWAWPVAGDVHLIHCRATATVIGGPYYRCGLNGPQIVATDTAWTLTADDVARIATETRRHVDKVISLTVREIDAWRDNHRIRVRDAARKRRALIEGLPDVSGVAS